MKKIITIIGILTIGVNSIIAQVNVTNHFGTNAAWYVGWDNATTFDLNIAHNNASYNINFLINNGSGTAQNMTLNGSTGHLGLGINYTPGNDLLDLSPDWNNFPNTGIGFNGVTILTNYGSGAIIHNIFTGEFCGPGITAGFNNAFYGYESGNRTTDGWGNTFAGYRSGFTNVHGLRNVYMGDSTGFIGLYVVS